MKSGDISPFREDIQALRGLAILLVLLYHAKLDFLKAGYLGVDIFFVVSGFLITQVIRKDLEAGTFSFSKFYFRRAKRLLPAAYVTFVVTSVLSFAFLTQAEARDYLSQLAGAVTFTGNFVLWRQTGYFDGQAHLKPLLHVWSLSIEEQYYMLLPAALFWLPRRHWLPAMAILLILSLALCFALAESKATAVFYLLPTRVWELALGSLGALLPLTPERERKLSKLVWPALLLLVAIPVFPTGIRQPWVDAAVVCVATLVVILGRHPALEQHPLVLPFARLGDFSYSLYLVHWPLFAFAKNAYVSPVPAQVKAALAVAALGLGYALYRFVERPVRQRSIELSGRLLGAVVAVSIALVAIPFALKTMFTSAVDYTHVSRVNAGFGVECVQGTTFIALQKCSNAAAPQILVWGDSFAMHLVPGVAATTDRGILQAAKPACGPFVGLAPIGGGSYQRPWAETCLQFNQSVIDYLSKTESVKYVILASSFVQYFRGKALVQVSAPSMSAPSNPGSDAIVEREPGIDLTIGEMRETVSRLRALGKKVVIVAPPPSSDFDVGRCLEFRASGRPILGADADDCRISMTVYAQRRAAVHQFLAKLSIAATVNIVDFDGYLCSARWCETELDGVFIYRDHGHLSVEGSRHLGIRMRLGERLIAAAS